MRVVRCCRGELQVMCEGALAERDARTFATGLDAVDDLLPGGGFAYGAVHEALAPAGGGLPLFFAALVARAAARRGGVVAWSDPHRRLYPPALAAAGIALERLLLLRPPTADDERWAVAECLRCGGISATVANLQRLSRLEARRLQLAVEAGGGAGILLRTLGPDSAEHAARTRWLIRPMPGQRSIQRWQLQLIHGHGGRVGKTVVLEACHETNHVRAFEPVADRPVEAAARRVRA